MKMRLSLTALALYCLASSPTAHAQQIKADTGGVAIGGNVSSSTINIGIPAEQLAALVRQAGDHSETQKKLIAKLEGELDLNQRQVQAALDILGEANVPPERLAAKLGEFAKRFQVLQAASVQPGDGPQIAALKADVQKAINAGELAKADALLSDVQYEQLTVQYEQLAVAAADTAAQRGEIALTRLRYTEAAIHFAHAAELLPQGSANEDKRIGYLESEARALFDQGLEFGDNGALLSAVVRYERLVAVYREALKVRVPLLWFETQRNLGDALRSLGYARFLLGNFSAAALDLQAAAFSYQERFDRTDAYLILWLYLARARTDRQDAKRDLEGRVAGLNPAEWPFPVIKMFLEQGTPEAMVAAADKPDERCEAQFYVGQWRLLRDERANSIESLRNAIKNCPKAFIEYAGALAELKRVAQ